MLAHHLMEHGAFRLAGRVPEGGDGGAAFAAGGGLARHEPRSWQPRVAAASVVATRALALAKAGAMAMGKK
mgnify:CR=1 FL=1